MKRNGLQVLGFKYLTDCIPFALNTIEINEFEQQTAPESKFRFQYQHSLFCKNDTSELYMQQPMQTQSKPVLE